MPHSVHLFFYLSLFSLEIIMPKFVYYKKHQIEKRKQLKYTHNCQYSLQRAHSHYHWHKNRWFMR